MRTAGVCRKPACTAAVIGVVLAAAVASAQGKTCPDGDAAAVRVDVAVDVKAGTISVAPDSVEIYLEAERGQPSQVCWVVGGLPDEHQLRLVGKAGDSAAMFPASALDRPHVADVVKSGAAAREGTWRYGARVENADGKVVAEIDPQVIVRSPVSSGGGSGGGTSGSGSGSDQ